MQQIADPPGQRSRRFPPRRRAVTLPVAGPEPEADNDVIAARMDRLESALRLVARANKEVLRTLDPRFDARAELASAAERMGALAQAVEAIRSELGATGADREQTRSELEGLRAAVEELGRRLDEASPGRPPRPVTRLSDVRSRLARVSEELDTSATR